jgi:hypothetical protein
MLHQVHSHPCNGIKSRDRLSARLLLGLPSQVPDLSVSALVQLRLQPAILVLISARIKVG